MKPSGLDDRADDSESQLLMVSVPQIEPNSGLVDQSKVVSDVFESHILPCRQVLVVLEHGLGAGVRQVQEGHLVLDIPHGAI